MTVTGLQEDCEARDGTHVRKVALKEVWDVVKIRSNAILKFISKKITDVGVR